ncbi:hypothetical protein [Phenylobacterium sp.]|uniref:hypothetical protein n=1 Tax=Phenylobacterium sp. TaxID=1871053 RepID=UPI002FE3E315
MTATAAEPQRNIRGLVQKHWGKLAASVAFMLSVSAWATSSIATEPLGRDVGWLGALGFVLTAWGVVISVGGFGVTIWQLHRTQNAATAVAAALSGIKRDYGSFEIVTELRTALGAVASTQSHVNGRRWDEALACYNTLRISLIKIIAVQGGLDQQHLETAKNLLATAVDNARSIQALRSSEVEELSTDVVDRNLLDLEDFLIHMEYNMKGAIRG